MVCGYKPWKRVKTFTICFFFHYDSFSPQRLYFLPPTKNLVFLLSHGHFITRWPPYVTDYSPRVGPLLKWAPVPGRRNWDLLNSIPILLPDNDRFKWFSGLKFINIDAFSFEDGFFFIYCPNICWSFVRSWLLQHRNLSTWRGVCFILSHWFMAMVERLMASLEKKKAISLFSSIVNCFDVSSVKPSLVTRKEKTTIDVKQADEISALRNGWVRPAHSRQPPIVSKLRKSF